MSKPTQKTHKAHTGSRRSHHALKKTATVTCSGCSKPMLPHVACAHCGEYKGKNVLQKQKRVDRAVRNHKKVS